MAISDWHCGLHFFLCVTPMPDVLLTRLKQARLFGLWKCGSKQPEFEVHRCCVSSFPLLKHFQPFFNSVLPSCAELLWPRDCKHPPLILWLLHAQDWKCSLREASKEEYSYSEIIFCCREVIVAKSQPEMYLPPQSCVELLCPFALNTFCIVISKKKWLMNNFHYSLL